MSGMRNDLEYHVACACQETDAADASTAEGNGFAMVTCDPDTLVAPIHPQAIITILNPVDVDTWLRGSYDEAVALQKPYDPDKMTVRGPVYPMRRKER